mmetsp:Transcript_11202/g.45580  ORF Transcript_11202/g.45580 Transcript_11202/m.45580 type:complete len:141 (-) Transcript_11202:82-504(-)|eukprot:CAMPEP_0114628788 /NCGR_PEP_ID=MMETSP0168-20121206/13011_1 /TAXON_ID=95228 ORGANISM="Vannella sp., Strain DIVA3 517/6/12" /NCGR_SAMPLE_ID=MMETSP0168 /ASSEMBLY_ACC=CAM_ASM_000044 /LENGTH=140 /DNA_ID=CAMNT_0001840201 /DNA_START=105 /DNA_END=527 /DNA_ORIENTATION=-
MSELLRGGQYLRVTIPRVETMTNASGEKQYTTYEVQTETNLPDYTDGELKVKRRYNDFLWLYERLKEEYTLTKNRKDPIPPPAKIPGKKALGRFKKSFIEKRRAHLEVWLNELSSHPVWPTLKPFRMFLSEPNMMGVIRY